MYKFILLLLSLLASPAFTQDGDSINLISTELSPQLNAIDLSCHSTDIFNGLYCPTLDLRTYEQEAENNLIIKTIRHKFGEKARLSSPEDALNRLFQTLAVQIDYVVKYELRGNPARAKELLQTMDEYLAYLKKLANQADFVLLDYYGSWGTRLNATTLYFIKKDNKSVLKIDHGL